MTTPEENREWLKRLAAELDELSPTDPPLSAYLVEYLRGALAAYLSGDAKSMDDALGLKRGRGRPPQETSARKAREARVILWLRMTKRKTWQYIADRLGRDVHDVQRIAEEHGPAIARQQAQALVRRLDGQ